MTERKDKRRNRWERKQKHKEERRKDIKKKELDNQKQRR